MHVVSHTAEERHVGVHYPCASGHYQDLMMIMKSIFTAASVNCDSNGSVKTEPDPRSSCLTVLLIGLRTKTERHPVNIVQIGSQTTLQ